MKQEKIRVGLVGCGRIGAQTRPELLDRLGPNWLPLSHADGVMAIPDFSLVACCDVDRNAAAKVAERYGVKSVYADFAAMLEEADLNLLCVATRGDVRPEILCAAAAAGIRAVHSEKPLAHSVDQAGKAARAIEDRNVAFSYGTLRNYMPIFREAARLGRDGALGELQSVTIKFGRTSLMWNHPHSVALLCMLCGGHGVDFVQANLSYDKTLASKRRIDTDPLILSATIGFSNGVTGHIVDQGAKSVDIGGREKMLSIVGDGGAIVQTDLTTSSNDDPKQAWKIKRDETRTSGRLHALLELRDALKTGKPPALSAMDAWQQHRILFAFAQSDLEGGRRIGLDEVDPELVITGRTNGRVA